MFFAMKMKLVESARNQAEIEPKHAKKNMTSPSAYPRHSRLIQTAVLLVKARHNKFVERNKRFLGGRRMCHVHGQIGRHQCLPQAMTE